MTRTDFPSLAPVCLTQRGEDQVTSRVDLNADVITGNVLEFPDLFISQFTSKGIYEFDSEM